MEPNVKHPHNWLKNIHNHHWNNRYCRDSLSSSGMDILVTTKSMTYVLRKPNIRYRQYMMKIKEKTSALRWITERVQDNRSKTFQALNTHHPEKMKAVQKHWAFIKDKVIWMTTFPYEKSNNCENREHCPFYCDRSSNKICALASTDIAYLLSFFISILYRDKVKNYKL